MNHDMMMAGPSGTFIGHLAPGIAFAALAVYWIIEKIIRDPRQPNEALERSLLIPLLKISALFIGGYFEMPNKGWNPMDWVMGWHHITVYMAFALSGVVDILAHKGLLSARSTYIAFAGASLIGALLFFGHGTDPGVEGTSHTIILVLFFLIGVFALLEIIAPSWNFEWYRLGSMLSLGVWMGIVSWVLYLSGWDLHDHVKEAHVWLLFSWMVLGITIIITAASIFSVNKNK